jgi:hypothetical protein
MQTDTRTQFCLRVSWEKSSNGKFLVQVAAGVQQLTMIESRLASKRVNELMDHTRTHTHTDTYTDVRHDRRSRGNWFACLLRATVNESGR